MESREPASHRPSRQARRSWLRSVPRAAGRWPACRSVPTTWSTPRELGASLLVKAGLVYTGRREIEGGWVLARDGLIAEVGSGDAPPADEVISAPNCVAVPGLVNAHDHMYQWPPPDSVVEDEDSILADTEAMIQRFHDPGPGSMCRVVVAPCSPFSVTPELMRESATLARKHGVRLHTHLAETLDEERFCVERTGRRPLELMEDLSWTGDDVWYAHGIHLNDAEVNRVAAAKTGIAHCPSSNMRLGSGTCRVEDLVRAGARVGLGVDGSATNEA